MANAGQNDPFKTLKDFSQEIPLHALNMGCRNKLATYLDPEGFVTGDFCNDYTGLAEIVGLGYRDIKRLERQRRPTHELLHEWGSKKDLNPTVDRLVSYLQKLGREDALEECKHIICKLMHDIFFNNT